MNDLGSGLNGSLLQAHFRIGKYSGGDTTVARFKHFSDSLTSSADVPVRRHRPTHDEELIQKIQRPALAHFRALRAARHNSLASAVRTSSAHSFVRVALRSSITGSGARPAGSTRPSG
jgi:hypothetical protein